MNILGKAVCYLSKDYERSFSICISTKRYDKKKKKQIDDDPIKAYIATRFSEDAGEPESNCLIEIYDGFISSFEKRNGDTSITFVITDYEIIEEYDNKPKKKKPVKSSAGKRRRDDEDDDTDEDEDDTLEDEHKPARKPNRAKAKTPPKKVGKANPKQDEDDEDDAPPPDAPPEKKAFYNKK